ncbi:FG-GAP-like repeat-containing protein [Corallococcus silvisoli]|uniref:FG-GAP-like repeat-containing protein n=1 Tax=Corallococcus silvisoli TaxID=2697031 RepID=UPI001377ABB5|nr:FG-GAP-like repeat-containing protein [Corallococcus silvisoli]NBD12295.1 hypothetical protein [Corallococcus silvisoli]
MSKDTPPNLASPGRLGALMLALLVLVSLRCTSVAPKRVEPQTLSAVALPMDGAAAPVGMLPGRFTPGANGDAQYSVAIDVPSGIQGLDPSLSLVYGSMSGDGTVGMGWQLQGLSAISRCKQTFAVDGVRGSIGYDAQDRFCLDGHRLINVTGAYGAPASVYRTELETWRQVQASQQQCGSGPCSFTVTTAQGQQWTYGASTDSRVLAVGRAEARVWALTQVKDLNGNTLNVSYSQAPISSTSAADGQFYPVRIDYTANATVVPAVAANRSVRFSYVARGDVSSRYVGGSPILTRALLSNVTTYVNDTAVKDYRLTYGTGPSTGRSRVTSARVCAGTGASAPCLPATSFQFQGASAVAFTPSDPKLQVPQGFTALLPGDVNGDGKADLLYLSNGQSMKAYVYLSTGTGFTACATPTSIAAGSQQRLLPMDVNGDGRVDLVQLWSQGGALQVTTYLSNATSCGFTATNASAPGTSSSYAQAYPMDVNGDGRTDLVLASAASGQMGFQTLLSNGQGFTAGPSTTLGGQAGARWWPMDVNADGQVDLVQAWQSASGATQLTAYLSNGQTFGSGVDSSFGSGRAGALAVWPVDVNADGVMDLVQGWVSQGTLNLQAFVSTGDGHFVDGGSTNTGRSATDLSAFWPMDVNGDGRTDLVQAWNNGGTLDLLVYRNTGAGFDSGTDTQTALSAANVATTYPMDVDGDGLVDLVQGWPNGSGLSFTNFIAQGPTPDLVSSVVDGLGGQVDITYVPMSDPSVYTANASTAAPTYPSSDALAYVFQGAPAQMPFQVVGGGVMQLVAKTVMHNALPGGAAYAYTDTYQYARALIDRQGRGWLGFQQVTKHDAQDGQVLVTTYNQSFPYTGTPSVLQTRCDATVSKDPLCPKGKTDTLLSSSRTDYSAVSTAKGATATSQRVTLVQKTRVQTDAYAYGVYGDSHVTQYQYDAYGNTVLESDLGITNAKGVDASPSDNVYTCSQYSNDAARWRLGYLTDTKVSRTSACSNFTAFNASTDFSLQHLTYTTDGRWSLASLGTWDSTQGAFLTTAYGYDGFGNRTRQMLPGGGVITTTYESAFHTYPDTKTFPANAAGTALSERYGYDAAHGTQVAILTTAGASQLTCLDAFGRERATQGPVPSSGMATDTNCVSPGVTGLAAPTFRAAAVATLKTQAWSTDALGVFVTENTLQGWTASGGTPDWRWTHVHLDGLGRSFKEVAQGAASDGNGVSCRVYDGDNRVLQESVLQSFPGDGPSCTPGTGGPTLWSTNAFDVYGRLTRHTRPAGSQGTETSVTQVAYTGVDTATLTSAVGDPYQTQKVFKYAYYRGQRKPLQIVVPQEGNATTALAYDALGRLTSVTDARTGSNPSGVTNTVTYDSLNRRLTADNPDQNTGASAGAKASTYAYDARTGYLSQVTDARGQTTRFTYDGLGRILTSTGSDGTVYTYGYDDPAAAFGGGQLTQVTGQQGGAQVFQSTFAYDPYGNRTQSRVLLQGEPSAYTTVRAYDPLARVRTLTYPDGTVLQRTYAQGNLTTLASGTTTFASYSGFNAQGNPQQVVYGNGARASYTYAPQGELNTQQVQDSAQQTLVAQGIQWDHLARVTGITDAVKAGGVDFSQLFTYANDRLSQASAQGLYGARTFAYDASGNLTNNNGVAYTYQAHRALKGTQGAATVFSLGYDASGNVVSKQAQGSTWAFTYDARNRLTQVTQGGVPVLSSLQYGPNGNRLRKVDGGGVTSLYPDPAYTVTKLPGGAVEATRAVMGPDGMVAAVTVAVSGTVSGAPGAGYPQPGTLYFHADHLGSTALTTDASGKKASQVAYLPYGGVFRPKTTGPDDFRPKFQGREADEPSGLLYFGARYYDPALGRFLTPDSRTASRISGRDSLNRFAFAINNPVTYTDPTGHSVWDSVLGATLGTLEVAVGVVIDVVSDGALESVGGAFIGAGINGIMYSATSGKSFSWKQYGIQQGVGAVLGMLTGGFGETAESGVGLAESEASQLEAAGAREATAASQRAAGEAEGTVLRTGVEETADTQGTSAADSLTSDRAPCPNSFVAGTWVATADGPRAIETLQAGVAVLSQDDATGFMALRALVATREKDAVPVVEVVLQSEEEGASERIVSTPAHPFWARDRGWTEVGRLGPDDAVYSAKGTWLRVVSVRALAEPRPVHDLQVRELRTYFVGRLEAWVHNCTLGEANAAATEAWQDTTEASVFWDDYHEQWRASGVAAYDSRAGSNLISVEGSGSVPRGANMHPRMRAEIEGQFGRGRVGQRGVCNNFLGACAEQRAANALLQQGAEWEDIRFTNPFRPRTGRNMPVCENCERLFGRDAFPRNATFDSGQ